MTTSGNPAPVIIAFEERGQRDVVRAFDSIESRMLKFEKTAAAGAARGSRERVSTTKRETDSREKEYQKLVKTTEKAERDATRAAARESSARESQLQRDVARRERLARQSAIAHGRHAKQQADAEIREAKRAASAIERIEEQKARAVKRARAAFGRGVAGTVSNSFTSAFSGAARYGMAAMAIGGGLALSGSLRGQLGADVAAVHLANSATVGGVRPDGADAKSILNRARAVSAKTGVDKTELIGAVQNYVAKSSDFKGGMENMDFFATMSKATGTRLEDITGAAGILRAQNKDLSGGDMRQMLLDMHEQGKQGAVEIQDMAHLAGALGSTRGLYAGNVADNQRKLLALSQLTRTESESPEEAATSVKDLGIEAAKKMGGTSSEARHLREKMGVKFNKSGQIEDVQQMIEASLTSTKGNLGDLEKVYGIRGVKTFQRLAPIFNKAGGGEAGLKAVRDEMNPIMNAKGSEKRLKQEYDDVMATTSERLNVAFTQLQEMIGSRAVPVLERFVANLPELMPKAEALIDAIGKLASYILDNPIKGIGALVLAKVSADLVQAGIGFAVKSALEKIILGSGGLPGGGVPGGGGVGGVAFGAIATTAAGVYVGAKGTLDAAVEGGDAGANTVAQAHALVARSIRSGDPNEIRDASQQLTGVMGEADDKGGIVGALMAATGVGTFVGDKAVQLVTGDQRGLGQFGPDGGSNASDAIASFTKALVIKSESDNFKAELTGLAAAAAAATKKIKEGGGGSPPPGGTPTGNTDPSNPSRNNDLTQRPVQ